MSQALPWTEEASADVKGWFKSQWEAQAKQHQANVHIGEECTLMNLGNTWNDNNTRWTMDTQNTVLNNAWVEGFPPLNLHNMPKLPTSPESALAVQQGGTHYKEMKIQPVEYIHANNIPFIEGCVIKYISRWRNKAGIQDLEKAKHFIDLLIELENKPSS